MPRRAVTISTIPSHHLNLEMLLCSLTHSIMSCLHSVTSLLQTFLTDSLLHYFQFFILKRSMSNLTQSFRLFNRKRNLVIIIILKSHEPYYHKSRLLKDSYHSRTRHKVESQIEIESSKTKTKQKNTTW